MIFYDRRYNIKIIGKASEIEITELRIAFSVKKTTSSSNNEFKVEIYNLNEKTRTRIEEKDISIELFAGYKTIYGLILRGDVMKVFTKKNGADVVTTLFGLDGGKAFRETYVSKSFSEGVAVKDVVKSLVESFGLPIKEIPNIEGSFVNGFSAIGSPSIFLDQLASGYNFEWSIQDKEAQIIESKGVSKDSTIVLSVSSGLIGSPEKIISDGEKLEGSDKKSNGIKFVSLLNHNIRPGRKIELQGRYIKGLFKVLEVIHEGDYRGSNWYSNITAEIA